MYHNDRGERFLNNLTRLNVLFLSCTSVLFVLEFMSPFFGFWHSFWLVSSMGFSLVGSYALHYYSTKMVNDIYLLPDGKHVQINFMSAFWFPRVDQQYKISNFGYFQSSRLLNVDFFSYQQKEKLYINLSRNIF
mmetsp:Transcript_18648/g.17739  ORF Transcript_18648/g.17739 Transcript_18648/m.17739 type:complete len:134 (-) Transcript_18648:135-536(-)